MIYLEIFIEKTKKSYTKMSNRLTSIKWYLVCVFICSIAGVFYGKPLKFLFKHPIFVNFGLSVNGRWCPGVRVILEHVTEGA